MPLRSTRPGNGTGMDLIAKAFRSATGGTANEQCPSLCSTLCSFARIARRDEQLPTAAMPPGFAFVRSLGCRSQVGRILSRPGSFLRRQL